MCTFGKSNMKTALFGGSFDPPHVGHLEIVRRVLNLPDIERIVVVPAWLNPFKSTSCADAETRLRWCRELFDMEGVEVDDFEVASGRRVYTVETVRELKRKYPSLSAIVIGSDNLKDIGKWRDFEKLDAQMEWIVVGRGEVARHELERLGRYRYIEMDIPVSSSRIRAGGGREYLDKRLAAEIEEYYNNDSGENI